MDKHTNQKKEEVTFVNCTAFGRTAEVAGEYLTKGRQILIEGYLKLEQWDDRESGQKRSKLKVIVDQLTMLGSKPGGSSGGGGGSYRSQSSEPTGSSGSEGSYSPAGDDVPF